VLVPFRPVLRLFRTLFNKDKKLVSAITAVTGCVPDNLQLYKLALTHTSFTRLSVSPAGGRHETNERLEFLGDAILGSIVAEYLFNKFPYKDEGFLTDIRSRIVNRESLNHIAMRIGLNTLVKIDLSSHAARHKYINGNALEALVGAVYLDKGYQATRSFVIRKLVNPHFDLHTLVNTTINFKSKLIEWAQSQNRVVRFELVRQKSSGNTTEFTVEVLVDDQPLATGAGLSKKKAEQSAAEKTLTLLQVV
jgi:ribonuclease III